MKYGFADVIEKQYEDFHKKLLESRKEGKYWSPYIIEFDINKGILQDSYIKKHGNRICIVGGPAELFGSKELTKSERKDLKPPTLGLVLSMDKSVDILQPKRVVLLHSEGFFRDKFILFKERYNERNEEKRLIIDTARYREEDLLILPKTRLLLERADFIIIGHEEKNQSDAGLLQYSFLPELGLGLSNDDLRAYIIIKGGKKEIPHFDDRIEFIRLDSHDTIDFDKFLEERIIIRIEKRSEELEILYWRKLEG